MSSIGNLINPQYYERQSPEKPSLASALNSILLQKSEEERKQKILIDQEERKRQAEIAAEQRKFERSKTLMDLFNSKSVNNNVSRADNSLTNSEVGAKVVKVPSNAMMSLVGGGFGDIQGNQVDSPMDKLFTTAASQKDPFQTRMVMSGVNADLEPTFKMVDENKDLPQIQRAAMSAGVDPTGKTRTQIMSEVASKKAIPVNKQSIQDKKFALELEDRNRQNKASDEMVKFAAQDTLNTVSEVEKGINNFGVFGSLPSIPGTDRVNWEANVNKLLARTITNLMSEMKQASKNGATGFGSLSAPELKVLQDASTVLKKDMKPEDAQRYLNDIKSVLGKVLQGDQAQQQTNDDPEYQKYLQAIGQ